MNVFAICCTTRSGSTYLCELLESAGIGRPDEYLNPTGQVCGEPFWRGELGLPEHFHNKQVYWQELLIQRSQNNQFGVKVARTNLLEFILKQAPDARLLWIRRRDTLRQAVSLYRARESGQFRHWQPAPTEPVKFDKSAILRCRESIEAANVRWLDFFRERTLHPLTVWYETVCAHPRDEILRIARWMGLDPCKVGHLSTSCQVQRDATTDQWIDRIGRESDA